MTPLDIFIHKVGERPVPDLAALESKMLAQDGTASAKMAFIEQGTASGLPSVALLAPVFVNGERRWAVHENTLGNFTMALAAARGAFPEAFDGGVFQPGLQERISRTLGILSSFAETDADDLGDLIAKAIESLMGGPVDG